MNCSEARGQLPAALYDDLTPEESRRVRDHVADCALCRAELAELERVRRALDDVQVPRVEVDLERLFRQSATVQVRQARRWRRLALTAVGVAAAVLLLFGLGLEVRVDARQLVVRWGNIDEARPVPPQVRQEVGPQADPGIERRLQVVTALVHALAVDLDERDAGRKRDVSRLQAMLEDVRRQDNARLLETERGLAALLRVRFGDSRKGELP